MKIGLLKNEHGWIRILEQEKIQYELVKFKNLNKYALLVINSIFLEREELDKIKNYVNNGGVILTNSLFLKNLDKSKKISKIYVKSLYAKNELFRNIDRINLQIFCYKIKNSNLIYKSKFGKGFIIALPFDLNKLMQDNRSKTLYLPSPYSPLKENISLVSKGNLRRLIVNCLQYLHFFRGIPYTHLWYYPNNYDSIFAYRIDLDVLNRNEMNNIIEIIKNNRISFTWFLSVINNKNFENELMSLKRLKQDLQSHSYKHKVYDSFEENYENILQAKRFISRINKNQVGFAAPFGYWNHNLSKALEKLNYLYSSEFSLSYDDFPFYPLKSNVLQIPIYPTCIGLMKQLLYSRKKMKNYFNYLIEMQYKKQMPLFFYDHPNDGVGIYPDVLEYLLKKINKLDNILITNLTEFAKFWKEREKIKFKINLSNNKLKIITINKNDFYLRIIFPGYKEARVKLKNQLIDFDRLNTKEIQSFKDIRLRNIDIIKSKFLFYLFYIKILIKAVKRRILN